MALVDILERGYFPKELPNPFVTGSFAAAITASGASLPADFSQSVSPRSGNIRSAKPVKYSLARGGLLRRQLSLPNPIPYYLLCRELDTNWSTLQQNIGGTALSATNPVLSATGRAIQGSSSQGARKELALRTRLNNKFILRTDISRFYPSIYTHCIPWVLHSKDLAKANRSRSLLGNRLDELIRNGQDRQTVGIPIGPDASLVIAEILMQKCDEKIISACPGIRGHRLIDDYELGFRNRSDAESAFHQIEKILAEYELALNPRKTKIVKLPYELEAPWASQLRSFTFRSTASGQKADLYRYFDLAYELHNSHLDEPVLQFAIGRLRWLTVASPNWVLFQRLLLHCVAPEPATILYVLESIIRRTNDGATPAISEIERVLNSLIVDHSLLSHSSEVAWALWGCLSLGITISQDASIAVSRCDDSVVALLALHCEEQGLVGSPLDHSLWSQYMDEENLYDDHWLLAYEANVRCWLPSRGGADHVSADPNFRFLKASGVSFYDATMAVPSAPGAESPLPSLPIPVTFSGVSSL